MASAYLVDRHKLFKTQAGVMNTRGAIDPCHCRQFYLRLNRGGGQPQRLPQLPRAPRLQRAQGHERQRAVR
eukprot:14184629-Alexandrium_andersonii.AAC.1